MYIIIIYNNIDTYINKYISLSCPNNIQGTISAVVSSEFAFDPNGHIGQLLLGTQ